MLKGMMFVQGVFEWEWMGRGIAEEVKKQWQQLNRDVNVQKANPSLWVCLCVLRIMLCWDEIFLEIY